MRIGKMRHRITFYEKPADLTNENGFPVNDWQAVKTVWAQVITLKGDGYFQAAQTQSETNIKFVIRYTTGIHADMKIGYGKDEDGNPRMFNIVSPPVNDDGLNRTMTIYAREVE